MYVFFILSLTCGFVILEELVEERVLDGLSGGGFVRHDDVLVWHIVDPVDAPEPHVRPAAVVRQPEKH